MLNNDSIRNLLRIEDPKITFTGEVTSESIKNINCTIVLASLTKLPDRCKCKADKRSWIKHGYFTSDILLTPAFKYKTYLRLKKCRYKCKRCGATKTSKTNIVMKNCHVSQDVKHSIAIDLKDKKSIKDIAKDNLVSTSTAYRVFKSYYKLARNTFSNLPEVIHFDEFKATKDCKSSMAFIYMDGVKGNIIDILNSRKADYIKKHFFNYSYKQRAKVKYIVMDMYAPYKYLIKKIFPNASIVIDRFHIVQHINRALNQIRITEMKRFNNSNPEDKKIYRLFKRYWKLILKYSELINYSSYKHFIGVKGLTTESHILDTIFSNSPKLHMHYKIYQDILGAIKRRDVDLWKTIISEQRNDIDSRFRTVIKTFRRFNDDIQNAIMLPYNNGRLEAMNNNIKVIKRISYGYRNFNNFKRRIMIIQGNLTL